MELCLREPKFMTESNGIFFPQTLYKLSRAQNKSSNLHFQSLEKELGIDLNNKLTSTGRLHLKLKQNFPFRCSGHIN